MDNDLRGVYKWEEELYKDMIEQNITERATVGLACNIMLETLFNLPDVPQTGKLLELGSGDGYNTVNLARWDYEITGIEVSESGVQIAQERLKRENIQNAQISHMDATAMTAFDDNLFDVVVDATCLHCIIDLEDRKNVLTEVHRVMKSSGSFLGAMVSQPYVEPMPARLTMSHQGDILYADYVVEGEKAKPRPVRIVRTLEELKAEFSENKFDLVWYEHRIVRPGAISHHFVYHAKKGT